MEVLIMLLNWSMIVLESINGIKNLSTNIILNSICEKENK
jgi:hypothetical protein